MRRFDRSEALLARARRSLAGGVSSPVRAGAPVPLYFTQGRGPRLRDVDGNWYIDYSLAWGPMILGYAHPRHVQAMRRAAGFPLALGAQHELEISVAERIQAAVPCAERVAFSSSGSEVVQLAHRLARAHTGRRRIVKFEGHYHGWMDSALVSYHPGLEGLGTREAPTPVLGSLGQAANVTENLLVAPWNRLDVLDRLLVEHGSEVAAIIMEPVNCNSGCLMPGPGYLEGVRALATRHGALLIFDEVITGFRIALGGAQAAFRVTPDLATFGKAVGGGGALSVVAGRAAILEQTAGAGVAFGGTFNGNPVSLAVADATLDELARDGGALLTRTNRLGEELMAGIRGLAARHDLPVRVTGFGTAFALHFTSRTDLVDYRDTLDDDQETLRRYLMAAYEEGLHLLPDGRMYLSTAHTETEVAETLEAVDRAFSRLRAPVRTG